MTFEAFIATRRAVANIVGVHVEFDPMDHDEPLPAMLYGDRGDDVAAYILGPMADGAYHLQIGNFEQSSDDDELRELEASLYAHEMANRYAGQIPAEIAAAMPKNRYDGSLKVAP